VGEWSGARRLMEVGLDGSQREHSLIRTMNGVQTTAWFAFDIDREGTCGPRDDIGLTIYSSDAMVQRRGREGFMGQWLEKGKGSYLAQGPMQLVSDPTGHYPWMWVFHDKWAWGLMTGDAGTNHVALLYLRQPEHAQPEQFDVALYKRGRDVWQYGTTPESGEEVPSFRLSMGRHGAHRLGGMATNDLARLSAADCAAHLKAGGRGMTPRLKLTDADCFAAQYAVYCHSDLAVYNLSPSAIGTPPPPPDSTGPVLTATGWPAGPVTVGNRLELDVAAQDPAGVAWVALYLDGAEVARDTALPYALVHELATPGEFLYSVAAEDTRGNRTVQAPRLVTVLPAPLPSQPDVTLYHKPGVTVEVKPYRSRDPRPFPTEAAWQERRLHRARRQPAGRHHPHAPHRGGDLARGARGPRAAGPLRTRPGSPRNPAVSMRARQVGSTRRPAPPIFAATFFPPISGPCPAGSLPAQLAQTSHVPGSTRSRRHDARKSEGHDEDHHEHLEGVGRRPGGGGVIGRLCPHALTAGGAGHEPHRQLQLPDRSGAASGESAGGDVLRAVPDRDAHPDGDEQRRRHANGHLRLRRRRAADGGVDDAGPRPGAWPEVHVSLRPGADRGIPDRGVPLRPAPDVLDHRGERRRVADRDVPLPAALMTVPPAPAHPAGAGRSEPA
jgi:hypothetical protein